VKLNVFYEEKKIVIQINNQDDLDIEALLKFIKEAKNFHVFFNTLLTSKLNFY